MFRLAHGLNLSALLCTALLAHAQEIPLTERQIMGWVESVRLEPWGFKFRARMDTGAKTSSMSARKVELFQQDGDPWVRFIFDYQEDRGAKEHHVSIERPVLRMARIKRHDGKLQARPVVEMELCINGQVHHEQFSLVDRTSLNYPVLLGRDALKDIAIIDPAATFLTKPDCGEKKKKKKKSAAAAPAADGA
ncbi:MAG: ATP-dependent zinc protease family protein [Nevskiales bacterium]